jgi:endonuclease YncB( thermonuclease family)
VIAGVATAIDGDTLEIHGVRIRIEGIDAPESSQLCTRGDEKYRCGKDAAFAVADLIGHHVVTCTRTTTDKYGRTVATCEVEGTDVGRWMVQHGQAVAYRKYSMMYVADEEQARAAKIGIWAGEFQNPADYRHQPRRTVAQKRSAGESAGEGGHHTCACPEDRDRAGRRCGMRSVFSRSGGTKGTCPEQH